MPFYEYECENCKFYTELLQKVTDAPLKKCPSCGKSTMKKLVSAPVFRLKGGGWYETDFKGDKENKRNLAVEKESESTSADPTAAKTDTKADAKPAADVKPAAAEAKTSGGGASASGSRKAGASRSTASASKARKPAAKPAAKAKAKKRARR